MQKVDNPKVEAKVLTLLEKESMPVSIDFVRYHLELQWNTARALLLSMTLDGKIKGKKTSKSWIFWIENDIQS